MRWRTEFYHERRGLLARYGVEASSPAAATLLGREALLAEFPPARMRRRPSLLERADRFTSGDCDGWVLYRIGQDDGPAAPRATPTSEA